MLTVLSTGQTCQGCRVAIEAFGAVTIAFTCLGVVSLQAVRFWWNFDTSPIFSNIILLVARFTDRFEGGVEPDLVAVGVAIFGYTSLGDYIEPVLILVASVAHSYGHAVRTVAVDGIGPGGALETVGFVSVDDGALGAGYLAQLAGVPDQDGLVPLVHRGLAASAFPCDGVTAPWGAIGVTDIGQG